ncbi:MAG TPA: GNAT family N-acetyltransferase [Bacteroidota bacterium]|nr:GNAT family N-acetyltransferase [Bacteroidota bacterium]
MTGLTFQLITTLAGLNALRDEWNSLAEAYQNPLLRHEWFFSSAVAFCPPDELSILVTRSGNRICGVAPLVRTRRLNLDHFATLGAGYLSEPTNFLYTSPEVMAQLLLKILEKGNPLILEKMSVDPMVNPVIQRACREKDFLCIEQIVSSPWIPLDSSWDAFECKMSAERQSSIRRARKRLQGQGEYEVEVVQHNSSGLCSRLEEAFRVEAAGWKGRLGTAILADPKLKAFFLTYAHAAEQAGILRLFFLRVNGRSIAMVFAVEFGRRLWILKIGYDENWRKYSPGILLLHETIRWAFERKLEAYEFLGSYEPWIATWTSRLHSLITYRLIPRSTRGILWLGIEGNRSLFRKASRLSAKAHAQ